jgi:phospholipid-binding lipoprotein MlaA
MLIFICHVTLSIYSYAFDNKTYYNSSGLKISKAEYDERCAKQSLKFAELKQLLNVDSQKQNDSQDVLIAFPKSAHAEPSPQKALLFAQAETDSMNLQKDPTDVDENDEDEYDDDEEYADDEDVEIIPDPFIVLNTAFYHVNDKLYFWLLKPVSKGYGIIIPQELRVGIRNVFYNIRFPVRFINCLLQGKFRKSGGEFGQFCLNTTVGFLGLANVAANYPALQPSREDLGQTFAVWGFGNGVYITIPFLGPSSFRDFLGRLGDTYLDPIWWAPVDFWTSIGIRAGETVNETSLRIGEYEALKGAALDPYVMIRNAYVQNRNKLIAE